MKQTVIPSRMAVGDADFNPHLACRLRISLDGVEQESVVAYDVEAGAVTRHRFEEDGRAIIEDERMAVEEVTGTVTVELREP